VGARSLAFVQLVCVLGKKASVRACAVGVCAVSAFCKVVCFLNEVVCFQSKGAFFLFAVGSYVFKKKLVYLQPPPKAL
jgi:hypothetical protein